MLNQHFEYSSDDQLLGSHIFTNNSENIFHIIINITLDMSTKTGTEIDVHMHLHVGTNINITDDVQTKTWHGV